MYYVLPHIHWIITGMFPTTVTLTLFATWLCAYFAAGLGAGLGWGVARLLLLPAERRV